MASSTISSQRRPSSSTSSSTSSSRGFACTMFRVSAKFWVLGLGFGFREDLYEFPFRAGDGHIVCKMFVGTPLGCC